MHSRRIDAQRRYFKPRGGAHIAGANLLKELARHAELSQAFIPVTEGAAAHALATHQVSAVLAKGAHLTHKYKDKHVNNNMA
eukprot:scaffold8038_cov39-Prasinocladus_malaysianus.AAC.2